MAASMWERRTRVVELPFRVVAHADVRVRSAQMADAVRFVVSEAWTQKSVCSCRPQVTRCLRNRDRITVLRRSSHASWHYSIVVTLVFTCARVTVTSRMLQAPL